MRAVQQPHSRCWNSALKRKEIETPPSVSPQTFIYQNQRWNSALKRKEIETPSLTSANLPTLFVGTPLLRGRRLEEEAVSGQPSAVSFRGRDWGTE
jgi:hypothetical protein